MERWKGRPPGPSTADGPSVQRSIVPSMLDFACVYCDAFTHTKLKVMASPGTRARFTPHGIVPDPNKPSPTWGQRLGALKHVPPLVRLVFQTHRGYTVAIMALRAVRSLIPVAVLWIGKLIIDAVIAAGAAARAGGKPDWEHLAILVALELGIAVVGEGLARLSSLLESLLGDLFANRLSVRLMQHAATLDLAQFEDSETY